MKLILSIILLTIYSLVSGQSLKGVIIDSKKNMPISWATVTLHSNNDKKQVTMAGKDGHFIFSKVDTTSHHWITFSAVGYQDTTFKEFSIKRDTAITLTYFNYCQYDVSIKNKTCPVCKDEDHVIPIVYGLPIAIKGKDPTKGDGKKFLLAGCEISDCDPRWYCKRDKTKF